WPHEQETQPLSERIDPPPGFRRLALSRTSFGGWLRELPVRSGHPDVFLYDGTPKKNQSAHALVLAVDVGNQDLQQCADAVMRLRAEYLWAQGRREEICFHFTSGDLASWSRWRDGWRPQVSGSHVRWEKRAPFSVDRAAFREYLQTVFTF